MKPGLPPFEAERLASRHRLGVLDTPPEERFDRLTRIATLAFDVPVALISIVDADRPWFKSCQGLSAAETPREMSFCGYAILNNGVFIVADTLADERFADNPLVTGEPGVRFYAGCPVAAPDGQRVGTLCLIDRQPRRFDEAQCRLLRELAALVEQELAINLIVDGTLEISHVQRQLQQSLLQLRTVHHLTTALGRARAVSEICDEVLNSLPLMIRVTGAAILLRDADGMMRFQAWRSLSVGHPIGAVPVDQSGGVVRDPDDL
ncbi:MAG: GAF domain-containing protein [Candidatus Sericytochromatia bacterium]|nr:GAF domain-containing protein [Candidatus Sericytochromatia bacterium]